MKYFKVNWKDGHSSYVRGINADVALSHNGINGTLSAGISGVEECTEIPKEDKQIVIIGLDKEREYLSGNLSFVNQIRTQLIKKSDSVTISVNDVSCHYTVEETPYEFILTKVA